MCRIPQPGALDRRRDMGRRLPGHSVVPVVGPTGPFHGRVQSRRLRSANGADPCDCCLPRHAGPQRPVGERLVCPRVSLGSVSGPLVLAEQVLPLPSRKKTCRSPAGSRRPCASPDTPGGGGGGRLGWDDETAGFDEAASSATTRRRRGIGLPRPLHTLRQLPASLSQWRHRAGSGQQRLGWLSDARSPIPQRTLPRGLRAMHASLSQRGPRTRAAREEGGCSTGSASGGYEPVPAGRGPGVLALSEPLSLWRDPLRVLRIRLHAHAAGRPG